MLDAHSRPFLFRALEANRAILFVGAGFSRDATNRLAQRLPDGKQLAATLWQWIGYAEPYDGSHLSLVFQAALTSGKSLSSLRQLLEEQLLLGELAEWYSIIPRVLWYRIYGTNADDVIETAYKNAHSPLQVISAPRDRFRERDQFLRRAQYIKLNGSLPADPRELTFATMQFAARANMQYDWWRHFVEDYALQPVLFVGSDIDEPLFWQAIAAREVRGANPEERPLSFLVSPSISPVKASVLESFNITHVAATGEQFFEWLGAEFSFPERDTVLSLSAPASAEVLLRAGHNTRLMEAFAAFVSAFPPVPRPSAIAGRPKFFLLGAPPTWEDIAAELDAPREVNQTLQARIEEMLAIRDRLGVIAVLGEGGAGKSTIMRRVALTLRLAGHDVFYSDGAERPDVRAVADAVSALPRRPILFIDNAAVLAAELPRILEKLASLDRPPLVIFASRFIPFEQRLRSLLIGHELTELEVPTLTDSDIGSVIATLARHNQLGKLLPMSSDDRRYEFRQRARKQILVAMREATEGKGFNEIIESEYRELSEFEARVLFLCAALGTRTLVDLSERLWFDCAEVPPSEALRILRRDLRGMAHIYPLQAGERLVAARHPVIAERILTVTAGRGDVLEAYKRVLLALARAIYPGVGRRGRAWRLFVRLINHQSIFEQFGEDVDRARAVYELTSSAFSNDGHFWLQYANLEIDHGEAENARPLLANAEGLLGETSLVLNTRAHMMLREALVASNYEEALVLRRDAEDILLSQMDRVTSDDEYPFHVYLTHLLNWIRAWNHDQPERKKRELEDLMQSAKSAIERMPRNRKLQGIYEAIFREYLITAT